MEVPLAKLTIAKPQTRHLTRKQFAAFMTKQRTAASLHAIATTLYKAMPNGARAKIKLTIEVAMPLAPKGVRRG